VAKKAKSCATIMLHLMSEAGMRVSVGPKKKSQKKKKTKKTALRTENGIDVDTVRSNIVHPQQ